MKELSIEEKAKAYNEALKKAKDMLSYKEVRREDMEYLFPELKESEDERIRKAIIEHFKWSTKQILYDYSNKKALTWLERQGEQKHAEWQKEQFEKDYTNLCKGIATAKGLAVTMAYDKGVADTKEQIEEVLLSEVLPCFMHGGEADEVVAKLDEVLNQKK